MITPDGSVTQENDVEFEDVEVSSSLKRLRNRPSDWLDSDDLQGYSSGAHVAPTDAGSSHQTTDAQRLAQMLQDQLDAINKEIKLIQVIIAHHTFYGPIPIIFCTERSVADVTPSRSVAFSA